MTKAAPNNGELKHDSFILKLALIASLSGLLFGYDTVSSAAMFLCLFVH